MAELLGRRWIDALDSRRYAVSLEALTGGEVTMLPGVEAIRLVTASLEPRLRDAGLEARLGKIVASRDGCEAGLFFDRGFAEGAVVSLSCPRAASEVMVLVGRSSPLLRGLVWGSLIGGCALGLLAAAYVFPDDWDSGLKLALGVLGGVVIALPALAMGPRIPSLAGGSSSELADALNDVVVSWLDALAPPKRKKRRKKKRPPPE
ncbi:MAG: hypothetical protein VYE22_13845 [Myxococcota bacterium]|nr:hypothetical protein [Myxococcota bacterium]